MPNRLRGIHTQSAELQSQGTSQTFAHGLRKTPQKAWIEITGLNATAEVGAILVTGIDNTNVIYDVTSTQVTDYIVHAIV